MSTLDNYTLLHDKVREVAERIESHQSQNQQNPNKLLSSTVDSYHITSKKDPDVDTFMTGINGLTAILGNKGPFSDNNRLSKGLNYIQQSSKKDARPRAHWRAHQEYQKFFADSVCARCTKVGHLSRDYPNIRATILPSAKLNAALLPEVDVAGSGKEDP